MSSKCFFCPINSPKETSWSVKKDKKGITLYIWEARIRAYWTETFGQLWKRFDFIWPSALLWWKDDGQIKSNLFHNCCPFRSPAMIISIHTLLWICCLTLFILFWQFYIIILTNDGLSDFKRSTFSYLASYSTPGPNRHTYTHIHTHLSFPIFHLRKQAAVIPPASCKPAIKLWHGPYVQYG